MTDGQKVDGANSSAEEKARARDSAEEMPHPDDKSAVAEKAARAADFLTNAPKVGAMAGRALGIMRARATGKAKPIPMPWPSVASALGGGLWPGLHVLTGTTGSGKTQFALQVAFEAACSGVPTLYIGLELGELDLTARLLALVEGKVTGKTPPPWSSMYLGKTADATLERLGREHATTLEGLPLHAEFGPPNGWGSDQLDKRGRAMREMYPEETPGGRPLLVVLDYLQAVGQSAGGRLELRERIGRAAYDGRTVARDLGAAVLMISSVSREGAKRLRVSTDADATKKGEATNPEKTSPADLVGLGKESGEIEYAADTVMALVSGEYEERKPTKKMHLAIAKMRAGRAAWCALEFDGSTFTTPEEREERETNL